jgi:hypothetical protein
MGGPRSLFSLCEAIAAVHHEGGGVTRFSFSYDFHRGEFNIKTDYGYQNKLGFVDKPPAWWSQFLPLPSCIVHSRTFSFVRTAISSFRVCVTTRLNHNPGERGERK